MSVTKSVVAPLLSRLSIGGQFPGRNEGVFGPRRPLVSRFQITLADGESVYYPADSRSEWKIFLEKCSEMSSRAFGVPYGCGLGVGTFIGHVFRHKLNKEPRQLLRKAATEQGPLNEAQEKKVRHKGPGYETGTVHGY